MFPADTTKVRDCGNTKQLIRFDSRLGRLTQHLDPNPTVRGADCRRGRHREVVPLVRKLPDSLTGLGVARRVGPEADILLRIGRLTVPWRVIARRTIFRLTRNDLATDAVRQGRDMLREAVDRTQEVGLVAWIKIAREGAQVGWVGGVLDALPTDTCAQTRTTCRRQSNADGQSLSINAHRCG